MISKVKPEIRILGWDDGPFEPKKGGKTVLVGVVFRGGSFMDGLIKREISVDGTDAEQTIIEAVKKTKFKDLRVIMLDGITFAGFNTVNIRKVFEETGLPVIAVQRRKPNFPEFLKALERLPHAEERKKAMEDAGEVFWADIKISGREGRIPFQVAGLKPETAREIIKTSSTRALVPEPLRVAHLIATGLVKGESVGRA